MKPFLSFTSLAACLLIAPLTAQSGTWTLQSRFDGYAANELFSQDIAATGDVDGDGLPDLICGSLWADPAGVNNAGSAYVYSGVTGALLYTFNGTVINDYFGCSVDSAGDVNGDGFDDLIIGAYGADPNGIDWAGSAYVYSGANGALLHSFDGGTIRDYLGFSVAGAGDVNNDGYDDIIIGAYLADDPTLADSGAAFVFSGLNGNLLHSFYGLQAGSSFGWSVDGVGDIDGDSHADLLIGAPTESTIGSVYLYSGQTGSLLYTFSGTAAWEDFGWDVAAAGDVDNDGTLDLIIGADWSNGAFGTEAGAAMVYSGASGLLLHRFEGVSSYDNFGNAVDTAGDVDNDGHADLLVGAWRASPGGSTWAGEAYLFSGATGLNIGTVSGENAQDNFGWDVAGGADFDGNGSVEILVSAPRADPSGVSDPGSAYMWNFVPDSYHLAVVPDPLQSGASADFLVTNGSPNTATFLAYSLFGAGTYPVPQLGVTLSLANPALGAGPNTTDAFGSLTWTINIPPAGAGRNLWIQALQMGQVTNLVATSIQ